MGEYVTVWVGDLPDLKRGEEIVRCRDCIYYKQDPDPTDPGWPMMCVRTGDDMVNPDGFCAWGERQDGDGLKDYRAEQISQEEARRLDMGNVNTSQTNGITLAFCPFCGAHGDIFTDGKRTWGLIEHNDGCFFPSFPKHEIPEWDFAAWNTRSITAAAVLGYEAAQAERTCHIQPHGVLVIGGECTHLRCWSCSECSYGWHVSDNDKQYSYCPNCGAKVVEHDRD